MKDQSVSLDEHNDASVPPVLLRVDFPKGQNSPPPNVTVKAQDRTVAIATHAVDIILQTLEEIHTSEEKQFRRSRAKKFVPIDADLHNIQLSLEVTLTIQPFSFSGSILDASRSGHHWSSDGSQTSGESSSRTDACSSTDRWRRAHSKLEYVIFSSLLIDQLVLLDSSDDLRRENERLREELAALRAGQTNSK